MAFASVWREVILYNPFLPIQLAQSWEKDAFQVVREAKFWSWAVKSSQFTFPAEETTGTVSLTNDSTTVTGSGTSFASSHVGLQIKLGNHLFSVSAVANSTSLTIDRAWPDATASGQGYSIFRAYVTVPTDFFGFISVKDPDASRRLWTSFDIVHIDAVDPQRTSTGNPSLLASLEWSSDATPAPMFEAWPHQKSVKGLDYLYWKIHPDFSSSQSIPYNIPESLIKAYVLGELCDWPGDLNSPNPMFSERKATHWRNKFNDRLSQLMVTDANIYASDVWTDLPMAPLSMAFIRSHGL